MVTFASKVARTHPVSYRGKMVVLVTPEYKGVHPGVGGLGETVSSIAQWQRAHGMRTAVVVPYTGELAGVPWQRTRTDLFFQLHYGRFGDVPVFAIGLEHPLSQKFPQGDQALRELIEFRRALVYLMAGGRMFTTDPAIIHFFDYPMGLAIGDASEFPANSRILFSAMDPTRYDYRYPVSDPSLRTATAMLPFPSGAVDGRGISGLEVGAISAYRVLFWSSRFYHMLRDDQAFKAFVEKASSRAFRLPGDWCPRSDEPISEETLRGMEEAYLDTLYEAGIRRSLHFIKYPELKIDRAFIFVSEAEDPAKPSRTEAVQAALDRAELRGLVDHVDLLGCGRNGVFSDYWENAGSLAALLERVAFAPDLNEAGRYVIVPDAGYFERGGALTLSAAMEGVKGLTPDGKYTLGIDCLRQAPILFRQLPGHGEGWVVFLASDNRYLPNGTLMAGEKTLWEISEGLVLSGQPEDVPEDTPDDRLGHIKSLGWWITDRDGKVAVFAEKTPLALVRKALRRNRLSQVQKNTFVFAMTLPTARVLVKYYLKTPCEKNGKPLVSAYPLDISSHILFPMTLTGEDWKNIFNTMQALRGKTGELRTGEYFQAVGSVLDITSTGLSVAEVAVGMLKFERPQFGVVFDHEADWMRIWEASQAVKTASGGLAGASMGRNSIWDDFGTLSAIANMWLRHLSDDHTTREVSRIMAGLPLDTNGRNVSGLENVTFVDPVTGQHLPPGKIPKDVVIVDTEFKHPVTIYAQKVIIHGAKLGPGVKEIHPDTVIVGGDIHAMEEAAGQQDEMAGQPRLLINCFTRGTLRIYDGFFHTSLSMRYAGDTALASAGLSASDRPVALAPIRLNLKEPVPPDQQSHPVLTLLDQVTPIMNQPIIVEDINGAPRSLGIGFWDVRGGY